MNVLLKSHNTYMMYVDIPCFTQWVQSHLKDVFMASVNILICCFKDIKEMNIVVMHSPSTFVGAKNKELNNNRPKALVLTSQLFSKDVCKCFVANQTKVFVLVHILINANQLLTTKHVYDTADLHLMMPTESTCL